MIRLEHLADGSTSDRNFQKLMALVPDMGGQSVDIRFGATTITYTASALSAATAITHGLGKTPVFAAVIDSEPGSHVASYAAYTFTGTQFTARGQLVDGTAASGNFHVTWVAIG